MEWRCVCGGTVPPPLVLIMPWASLAAPQAGARSLPLCCAPSLPPGPVWGGLHSQRPSRGSPLLSLRLSSAPAAPWRERPPFLQKGGGVRPAARAEGYVAAGALT